MYLRRAPRAASTAGEAGMNPALPATTSAASSVASKKPTRPTVAIEDTPGIYNPDHVTALLTAREHHAVQPRKRVRPRIFTLNPGQSLMLGAVGRLDYVDGSCHAILTVFVADEVKLHQTNIEKAGELLSQLAADNDGGMFPANADDGATMATPQSVALTPPFRGPEDCPFPPLSMVTEHRMMGKGWQRHDSAGDVVLPGIGWISVAVRKRTKISFETRLPEVRSGPKEGRGWSFGGAISMFDDCRFQDPTSADSAHFVRFVVLHVHCRVHYAQCCGLRCPSSTSERLNGWWEGGVFQSILLMGL